MKRHCCLKKLSVEVGSFIFEHDPIVSLCSVVEGKRGPEIADARPLSDL